MKKDFPLYEKELKLSDQSFDDIIGAATPFYDAIGRVSVNFAVLEDSLSSAITLLLRSDNKKGLLITSEMSFKAKLNVMAALVKEDIKSGSSPFENALSDFEDLIYMCQKSEEIRNRILHSSWIFNYRNVDVKRVKRSAKRKGFVEDSQTLTPGQIVQKADYIIYTATCVEELFEVISNNPS